ncbi:hypothetical protein [Achromobacter denitrificans]|uniref:DUF551 domain-containing protein n=1 Tax=Achromobacter denitrificans TaxID=32002 RepID=A0ABZ3GAG7_ACHDE
MNTNPEWKLVPVEPTPEILAAASLAAWPVASAADMELARKAARIVLMSMDAAPGSTLDSVAAAIATMAPAYRAMLAAAPAPVPSAPGDAQDAVIAGALFDLMGFLTTLDEPVSLGSTEEAAIAVELLQRWAAKRGLNLDGADVKGWKERRAAPAAGDALDWYERRRELEPGMIFRTAHGVVKLDRGVPGDGTKWYVLDWNGDGWSAYDDTVEPGDLIGAPVADHPIAIELARTAAIAQQSQRKEA